MATEKPSAEVGVIRGISIIVFIMEAVLPLLLAKKNANGIPKIMSTIQTEIANRILVSKLLTTAFMFSLFENKVELMTSQLKGTYVATKIDGRITNKAKKRIEKRLKV
jgi:hypothetical protein